MLKERRLHAFLRKIYCLVRRRADAEVYRSFVKHGADTLTGALTGHFTCSATSTQNLLSGLDEDAGDPKRTWAQSSHYFVSDILDVD
jgi:hypothetical protein